MFTIKVAFPSLMNLGVFYINIKDFQIQILQEIRIKQQLIKEAINNKLVEVFKTNEELQLKIKESLQQKPQTIDQYIKITQYLEGNIIKEQFLLIKHYEIII